MDVIQSYGFGVRREKKAMEDDKSLRLVYRPDNDTDDYTQVVASISDEFARIREGETGRREQEELRGRTDSRQIMKGV